MIFKKKDTSLLQTKAPDIAFWVAAVILIFFDARVLDVTYKLTASPLLTIGALFSTGAMFFVWKVCFSYTLADRSQVTLSSIGMALGLLASAVFGGMDYFVRGGLVIDAGTEKFSAITLLFWGIPVLSVIHVIMLLFFWYIDPRVKADRRKKEADDDHEFAKSEMLHAEELLRNQQTIISNYVSIAQKYGTSAALKQLETLGIDPAPFREIKIDRQPAKDPSHGTQENKPAPVMESTKPQFTQVMAGSNGNGSKGNPTTAA